MNPAALAPSDLEWLRLLAGTALYLLPGLAWADRLRPRTRIRFLLAPVLSFTALTLLAFAADLLLGIPVSGGWTAVLTLVSTAWIGRARIQDTMRRLVAGGPWNRPRVAWATIGKAAAVFGLVALVQGLPHLPGDGGDITATEAYPALAGRLADLAQNEEYPYPVHVDTYYHMAVQGEIARSGKVQVDEPYTGAPDRGSLFSVSGFRTERGFDVAIAQVHLLTGASLPFIVRVLPALWAGYTAVLLGAVLMPARGAWLSAAFLAMVPTTVRHLGPGFLVPIAFAAPWIVATLWMASKGKGPTRFSGVLLLVTGAFFQHLVAGTLALATAGLAGGLREASARERMVAVASAFLPLLWVLPPVFQDAVAAVSGEHTLPFEQALFARPGWILYGLFLVGAASLTWRPRPERAPHRTLAVLVVLIGASALLSIRFDHHNDATYTRMLPTFFLAVAALAGLGLGELAGLLQERLYAWRPQWRPSVIAAGLVVLVAGIALAAPVADQLDNPYYRIFDGESWGRAAAFADSPAGPEDVFLSHPWRAPLLNALTGARPYAVLYPGSPPVNDADYRAYRVSAHEAGWYAEAGIDWVVGDVAPTGPSVAVDGGVFRMLAG